NANLATAMVDNVLYTIVTQANALSGLTQTTYTAPASSFTVIMDKTVPTTSVSAPPAQNASYKSSSFGSILPSLSGTDADPNANASGVKDVQVRLSYLLASDTYYWTGASFS